MTPDVAVVMGTWDRLRKLQACVASVRAAAGGLTHVVLAADAGSVDGTRAWLADQPDCELLEGGRDGAVKAFNTGYARAVDLGSPWIVTFNDDISFKPQPATPQLTVAVQRLVADPRLGVVGFASDRYPGHAFNLIWGITYPTQCLFRREAGMAVARAQGDPTGKAMWDRRFHTYASDTCFGLWLRRLGWGFHEARDLWVHDPYSCEDGLHDPLRQRNHALYTNGEEFRASWPRAAAAAYNRADAARYGGVLR